MLPINQPQALSIVYQVGGEQIVVAQDYVHWSDKFFQLFVCNAKPVYFPFHAPAILVEKQSIATANPKWPEPADRASNFAICVVVGAPRKCQDASQVAVIPHIGHIKGTPIYVSHNNGFRLGMMNFRRDTGGIGIFALVAVV